MQLRSRSYVYDANYFERFNDVKHPNLNMFDLLCEVTCQDKNMLTDIEKDNLIVDAMYSILANYTSFMKHIDEVRRDNQLVYRTPEISLTLAIETLEKHVDHIYLLYPEDIFGEGQIKASELSPALNTYFYDLVISNESDEKAYTDAEKTFIISKIVEDMLICKLYSDLNDFALDQPVIPVYMNLVHTDKDHTAIHIIIFEPMESIKT